MNGIDVKKFRKPTVSSAVETGKLTAFLQRDISLFNPFGDKQKEAFYHGLGILLAAGVDIKSAFELIIAQQKNKKNAQLLQTVKNAVVSGTALSSALESQPAFTPYEYYSIQIGEETGQLAPVMESLATFYRKRIKQKRQVSGAMVYPAVVSLTSVGAVFFMLNFIVPMFADIFTRSGSELPAITQFIVSVSQGVKDYAGLVFLALAGTGFWLYRMRRTEKFRKHAAGLMLRLPIFGPIIHKVFLSRFCTSMALLTSARVPLTRALALSRQMVDFYPIEQSLAGIDRAILQGVPLHEAMAAYPIYEPKLVSLIKVGEEVNKLPEFFSKTAEQYQEEIEYQSATLSTLLEPFIIIFLGIFVGIILIAMYLPLFQLGSGFN